jgi:hypothetical protein
LGVRKFVVTVKLDNGRSFCGRKWDWVWRPDVGAAGMSGPIGWVFQGNSNRMRR